VEQKTLGRYKILGELGRGAMGAVYRAVDPLIERDVAIKTLLPNLPPEVMDEVRERFIREARSAGRLNHPNIVTIFDVGEHEGVAYIAMELLEGRSLQQVMKESRLSFDAIAELAAQVADALDAAYQFKIVHRDVKPANIMVAPNGRAKLTDFGVARVDSSSMTQTGAALGSPKYMSPEQVLGLPVDPRSDVFSLGVVLYEMLTQRTPFERPTDTTVFSLMNRIAGEPHPALRSIDPKVPEGFERIVSRALAKKPEQRYARAGEMAAELRALRGGTGMPAAAPAYEKTMVVSSTKAASQDPAVATQLITDLEKFANDFEHEERARIRAEEEARQRKEEALRRWAEEQERQREAFHRTDPSGTTGGADTTGALRRGALDFLKKQASTTQSLRDDTAAARQKALAGLDAAMRAAFQYLAEVVKEMNALTPTSALPYHFLYLGKLPAVKLAEGFVDMRPIHLPGKDICERVTMRYRVMPASPVRVSLIGEDIKRCIEYLKSVKVEYKAQAEARNEMGKVTKAAFLVNAALPCEILMRGDYEAPSIVMELHNVRRPGRAQCRLGIEQLQEATDDLARYVLGVDDDFEKLLAKR
jgi:hypothetical protein